LNRAAAEGATWEIGPPADEDVRIAVECLHAIGWAGDARKLKVKFDRWDRLYDQRLEEERRLEEGRQGEAPPPRGHYIERDTARRFVDQLLQLHEALGIQASISEQGTVDDSAFVSAKDILELDPEGYPKDYTELRRALEENPGIRQDRPISERTGQPVKNRLRVHAGDWIKHLLLRRQREQATADLILDVPAHVVDATVEELKSRQKSVRRAADCS
jgi:hypothetical protein